MLTQTHRHTDIDRYTYTERHRQTSTNSHQQTKADRHTDTNTYIYIEIYTQWKHNEIQTYTHPPPVHVGMKEITNMSKSVT